MVTAPSDKIDKEDYRQERFDLSSRSRTSGSSRLKREICVKWRELL